MIAVALATFLLCGVPSCSNRSAGATPADTVNAYVSAFNAKDAQALLGLLSAGAVSRAEQNLDELRSEDEAEKSRACAMMQIEAGELDKMTAKDYIVARLNAMFAIERGLEKQFGKQTGMRLEIRDTKTAGERATVLATNVDGTERAFSLVKEGSVWKLDEEP
jgi:hypothetical protein